MHSFSTRSGSEDIFCIAIVIINIIVNSDIIIINNLQNLFSVDRVRFNPFWSPWKRSDNIMSLERRIPHPHCIRYLARWCSIRYCSSFDSERNELMSGSIVTEKDRKKGWKEKSPSIDCSVNDCQTYIYSSYIRHNFTVLANRRVESHRKWREFTHSKRSSTHIFSTVILLIILFY